MSRPRLKLTSPIPREWPLQEQIAKVLAIEIGPPGHINRDCVTWFSVDHSNYAGQVPAARIGRGIIAGIPDIFIIHLGRAFLIEIKTLDGELSEPQRAVIAALLVGRTPVGVARDWSEVLAILDRWQIPRNRRIREAA
jgi:hypothetical protein